MKTELEKTIDKMESELKECPECGRSCFSWCDNCKKNIE
jgi:hypothetical protein